MINRERSPGRPSSGTADFMTNQSFPQATKKRLVRGATAEDRVGLDTEITRSVRRAGFVPIIGFQPIGLTSMRPNDGTGSNQQGES
jgi:hypothetical protein